MLNNWSLRTQCSPLINLLDVGLFGDLQNGGLSGLKSALSMKVDILENEKEFLVDVDLPGVEKKDIQIDFKDSVLNISVESVKKESKENEKIWKLERSYEKKSRSIYFETSINDDELTAKYDKGVLSLVLPKKIVELKSTKVQVS